jgi:DNA-binding PadR family transcriptional regulator
MRGGDRQSFEFTILAILEYLVRQEPIGPVTKYHLMNRVPGIPSQRQDRVSAILDLLVQRGWVTAEAKDNTVAYLITHAGKTEYDKWVKQFLAWVRTLRTPNQHKS